MIFDLEVPQGPYTRIGITPDGEITWLEIDDPNVPLGASRPNPQTGDDATPLRTILMQLFGLFAILAAAIIIYRRRKVC